MIEGPELPWPMESGAADCPARASGLGSTTAGTSCERPAAYAVEVRYPYDGSVWLMFLCERHGPEIPDARPLTATDRAEVERRRIEIAKALSGQPYERAQPLVPGRRRR